ncbi:MAG: indole-3-glycerol phosphate synthase TrpC [Chromatiales bacterium]|nr:indole-3-glycerol phosphate synthase TrpC [Chromatiales bacterium]
MSEQRSLLSEILAYKQQQVAELRKQRGIDLLKEYAQEQGAPRGFAHSLKARVKNKKTAIIAEIKRASPSKGTLCVDFNPLDIARDYMMAGATCLSVLTDKKFFKGSGAILDLVRRHCMLPTLQKDFIIDEYQIYESRALGADCILLIVAALPDDAQLQSLHAKARELNMDVLVEIHDQAELQRALTIDGIELIGINNRNLHTFKTDIGISIELAASVAEDKIVISESGINTPDDIQRLAQHNIHACLIGEALMTAANRQEKLIELLGGTRRPY